MGLDSTVLSVGEPEGVGAGALGDATRLVPVRGGNWSFLALPRAVRRVLPVDVVVVESALLLPGVAAARPRSPIMWDTNELETLHYRRLAPSPRSLAYRWIWHALEWWAVRRTDAVVAVSEAEAGWWRRIFPHSAAKLGVVPLEAPGVAPQAAVPVPRGQRTALAVRGQLTREAQRLGGELAPQGICADNGRRLALALIGPGTERLAHLVPPGARVELGGEVSIEELNAWIQAADICLAPLASGAGVKTKVLHYVAHAKRVVGTSLAFEGIEDCPGTITGSLEDLPQVVRTLLRCRETPSERSAREAAQRAWIASHHGRGRTIERWRAVFARVGVLPGGGRQATSEIPISGEGGLAQPGNNDVVRWDQPVRTKRSLFHARSRPNVGLRPSHCLGSRRRANLVPSRHRDRLGRPWASRRARRGVHLSLEPSRERNRGAVLLDLSVPLLHPSQRGRKPWVFRPRSFNASGSPLLFAGSAAAGVFLTLSVTRSAIAGGVGGLLLAFNAYRLLLGPDPVSLGRVRARRPARRDPAPCRRHGGFRCSSCCGVRPRFDRPQLRVRQSTTHPSADGVGRGLYSCCVGSGRTPCVRIRLGIPGEGGTASSSREPLVGGARSSDHLLGPVPRAVHGGWPAKLGLDAPAREPPQRDLPQYRLGMEGGCVLPLRVAPRPAACCPAPGLPPRPRTRWTRGCRGSELAWSRPRSRSLPCLEF